MCKCVRATSAEPSGLEEIVFDWPEIYGAEACLRYSNVDVVSCREMAMIAVAISMVGLKKESQTGGGTINSHRNTTPTRLGFPTHRHQTHTKAPTGSGSGILHPLQPTSGRFSFTRPI